MVRDTDVDLIVIQFASTSAWKSGLTVVELNTATQKRCIYRRLANRGLRN